MMTLNKIIKSVSILSIIFLCPAFSKEARDVNDAERQAFIQAHRPFWYLRAVVEDQKVHLNFSKTTGYSRNQKKYNLSDNLSKIRIYRKVVELNFNWDRAEVLDGLICTLSPGDIIYEGPIEVKYDTVYDYYDTTAKQGQVYAYFVAGAKGPITGPAAVKIRAPQVWWTKERIASELNQLQKDYPKLVKVKSVGKSHRGNDILSITVGSGKKKLAMIGTIHASESGPELIIPFIREVLENHKSLLKDVSLISIPSVNVDERQRAATGYPFYLRRNVTNVDLNRNFPANWKEVTYMYGTSSADPMSGTYRGPAPASEPETQAVVSFLRANRPDVIFSYHHLASVTGKCFFAPAVGEKDATYSQRCMKIYDAYDAGYSSVPMNTKPQDVNDNKKFIKFIDPSGTLSAFGYYEFNVPAFDVERHWGNDGLGDSNLDHTTLELLKLNQKQHAAALLKVMQCLNAE